MHIAYGNYLAECHSVLNDTYSKLFEDIPSMYHSAIERVMLSNTVFTYQQASPYHTPRKLCQRANKTLIAHRQMDTPVPTGANVGILLAMCEPSVALRGRANSVRSFMLSMTTMFECRWTANGEAGCKGERSHWPRCWMGLSCRGLCHVPCQISVGTLGCAPLTRRFRNSFRAQTMRAPTI